MTGQGEKTIKKNIYKNTNFFSRYGLICISVGFVIIFSILAPAFLNGQNWSAMLVGQVPVGIVALAGVIPLIAGEFDLSVAYLLGCCCMVGGWLTNLGASSEVIVICVFLSGALAGLINGLLSVKLRMNSTVVTLGMGLVYYGLNMLMSDGQTIIVKIEALTYLAQTKFLGINLSVWLLVILAGILYYLFEHTPFGKKLYATGKSARVAHLSGIRTDRMKMAAFIMCGTMISIGALIMLGRSGSAIPATGPSYLLPAYAVVFLSITTHRPGEFNVPGLLLSLLMVGIGFSGLNIIGIPYWTQSIFNCIMLLAAILSTQKDNRVIKIGSDDR